MNGRRAKANRRAKLDRKAYLSELKTPTVGDAEPLEPMRALITVADEFLNGEGASAETRRYGVILLVSDLQKPEGEQRVNYVSNGLDRGDVAKLFEELISRWRASEDSGIPSFRPYPKKTGGTPDRALGRGA